MGFSMNCCFASHFLTSYCHVTETQKNSSSHFRRSLLISDKFRGKFILTTRMEEEASNFDIQLCNVSIWPTKDHFNNNSYLPLGLQSTAKLFLTFSSFKKEGKSFVIWLKLVSIQRNLFEYYLKLMCINRKFFSIPEISIWIMSFYGDWLMESLCNQF